MKSLNLISVVSIGIGSIVGAGIFALLGQVIVLAESQTYLAFIIAGLAALFCGHSYARLAAVYPQSGGLTDYFHHAFKSPLVSGGLSLVYVLASAISISMMAKSFGIYAAHLFPTVNSFLLINFVAAGVILVLAGLNMMGASDVGGTETFFVAIKVLILVALVGVALFHLDFHQAVSFPDPHPRSFFVAVGITFFAYAGFGVITNAAADVAHPAKTIRNALYLTLFIVMSLYISLAFVVLHYVPVETLQKNPDVAVALVAKELLGEYGSAAIYVAAVVAFITGISATFFSIFRISHSLTQQKILPAVYVRRFWREGSWGDFLSTLLIVLATVLFDFSDIVNFSSGAFLLSYLGIFAAHWVLRRETKSSSWPIAIGFLLMIGILIGFLVSLA